MKYIDQLKSIISNTSSIIGKDKYINSAVLIPIIVIDGIEYLLFEKRSQSVRQPGEVSFPGGHFDVSQDVDYLSTAIRETCEELGISENKISIIGKLGTLVAPMGVIVEAYLGTLNINSLSELEIDKQEVENVFIIPLDFFIDNKPTEYFTRLELYPYITKENGEREELLPVKELGLPDIYSLPWKNNKHRVLVYRTNDEIIWGITAELTFELSNKLKEQIEKKYKHIIWDWNGTLLNDVDYCRRIINRILVENNLPELSLEKYKAIFTFPVQDYYKIAGLDFSKTSFEILGKDFIDEYESKKLTCSLHDNAAEVLLSIHKAGIGQSVLSAYLHENLVNILNHYNLTQYFENIIGLDNIYAGSKTHLGLTLVEQLNLPKDEILFIGDTLHDAEVAEAMGVNCILIANGHQVKEKLILNNNMVLENINQLQNYLEL